jgi:hypothetical protein
MLCLTQKNPKNETFLFEKIPYAPPECVHLFELLYLNTKKHKNMAKPFFEEHCPQN